eukprot:scaffold14058_cov117-Isochrysis_galbana.AAC.6
MSAGHTRRWAMPARCLPGQARPAAGSRGACTLAPDTVSCCDDGARRRRRRMARSTCRPDVQVVPDDLRWSCVGRTYVLRTRKSGKVAREDCHERHGGATGAISSSFVVCYCKKTVVSSCSHSRFFTTPPRPVEGPEELNFARVGGGIALLILNLGGVGGAGSCAPLALALAGRFYIWLIGLGIAPRGV